jgi:TIR domain
VDLGIVYGTISFGRRYALVPQQHLHGAQVSGAAAGACREAVDIAGVPIRGPRLPPAGHTERANSTLGVTLRKVFVSYARANRPHVGQLVEHLGVLDCQTWFDSSLRGGQDWWEQILDRITDCDVFIAIISREALNSVACEREFDWAEALGKPVLPVALERPSQALPLRFSRRQIVDYSETANRDRAALILAGGLAALPAAPPLPEPLPEGPSAPLSYLTELVDRVSTPGFLDHDQQRQVLFQLEAAVRSVDPEERRGGRDILERFSSRDDLYADVDRMITWLKESAAPETDAKTVVAQDVVTTAPETEPTTTTEPAGTDPAPKTDSRPPSPTALTVDAAQAADRVGGANRGTEDTATSDPAPVPSALKTPPAAQPADQPPRSPTPIPVRRTTPSVSPQPTRSQPAAMAWLRGHEVSAALIAAIVVTVALLVGYQLIGRNARSSTSSQPPTSQPVTLVAVNALEGLLLSPDQINTAMGTTGLTITRTPHPHRGVQQPYRVGPGLPIPVGPGAGPGLCRHQCERRARTGAPRPRREPPQFPSCGLSDCGAVCLRT